MTTRISSTDPTSATTLLGAWGPDAAVQASPTFDEATAATGGTTLVLSHVGPSTGPTHPRSERILEGLRHHVAWMRAVEQRPPDARSATTLVLVTDVSGDGRVVAAAVAQLAAGIAQDLASSPHCYCLEIDGDANLPLAVKVARALVRNHVRVDLPLRVGHESLTLRSSSTARRSVVLTDGWTPQWLGRALSDDVTPAP